MKKTISLIAATTLAATLIGSAVIARPNAQEVKVATIISRFSDQVDGDGNSKILRVRSGIVNFVAPDGNLKEIQSEPVESGNGFEITDAPFGAIFPAYADGVFSFKEQNGGTSPTLDFERQYVGAAHVKGQKVSDGILYPNAFPLIGADLYVKNRKAGLDYLIRWQSNPVCVGSMNVAFSMSTSSSFSLTSNGNPVGLVPTNVNSGVRIVQGDRRIDMLGVGAWDSGLPRKKIPVTLTASKTGNSVTFTKSIDCSGVQGGTFPVYADDTVSVNIESDTWDGRLGRDACGGTTWGTMVNATASNYDGCNADSQSETSDDIYEYQSGGTNAIERVVQGYHPTLAAGTTVTAVSVCLYVGTKAGSSFSLVTTTGSVVSTTTLNVNDYGTFPNATVHPPQEIADRVAVASISTGAYNCIPLNAAGVAYVQARKNAILWIGFRGSHDADGSATGVNNQIQWNSDNNASNNPYLSITYTSPPAAATTSMFVLD